MNDSVGTSLEQTFGKPLDPEFQLRLQSLFRTNIVSATDTSLELGDQLFIPVVRNIPRFVPSDQYANSFSYQWTTFTQTQLDSAQGSNLTQQDLIGKIGLRPADVKGKLVLDAGVGVGRHAEILASWGAFVVGVDLSDAVESARHNLAKYPNAVVIQGDIGNLPFALETFDFVVSIGVLHHTPDTKLYTNSLIPFVKPGGRLSIWVYPPKFARRGEWVPMASHLPLVAFKEWCEWAVDIARENKNALWLEPMIKQFPFSTHHANSERSVLALFDGFSPTFHWTHSSEEVTKWFHEAGLVDIHSNAIETSVSGLRPRLSDLLAIGDGVSV